MDGARNQSAGGGRINWMATGRKIGETSGTTIARTAVAKTGAEGAGVIFSPVWAIAQIEQEWCDVDEFSSACEWTACTVPITHTRTAASMHTALTHPPRFANVLSMSSAVDSPDAVACYDSTLR